MYTLSFGALFHVVITTLHCHDLEQRLRSALLISGYDESQAHSTRASDNRNYWYGRSVLVRHTIWRSQSALRSTATTYSVYCWAFLSMSCD